MFYAVNILASKGKLSAAWVAAYFDRRLTKSDIQQVNIEETVKSIETGEIPELALRTSSHILLGLSKILFRKTKLLYDECKELFISVKRKPSPEGAVSQKVSRAQITFPIDLFKHMKLPAEQEDADLGEADIEVGRGVSEGMLSNLEYSMSLNDISLSLARTLEEAESTENSQNSLILGREIAQEEAASGEDGDFSALSAITLCEASEIADTLLQSPVKPQKRASPEEGKPAKKPRLEEKTEIEEKHLKAPRKLLAREEHRKMVIPAALKGIYKMLQEMPLPAQGADENTFSGDKAAQSTASNSFHEMSQILFGSTLEVPSQELADLSVEAPRGVCALAPVGEEISFLQDPAGASFEALSEDLPSLESIAGDMLSESARKKAEAFVRLLRRVSDGTASASQESAYGAIAVCAV
ncbi:uncharacterized protein NEMAJ01_1894 [Nematocida major]|uniref:uncharacterized protein n=1 Tax=Nematocida major TaxID=1912982 RepID=UPI0020088BE1|nr:uncharacterized protein NEMAJ01_1894 [Nematocida major]KAH9386998.1 hypothetical protein NEMAJ01_1894 [Nematocida major]